MAYGFLPVGGIDGRPYNGALQRCVVLGADTTDIYIGDMVRIAGTGDAAGVPDVTKCAAGEVIYGAVVSVEPSVATSNTYVLGSITTDQYVNVAVATDAMLFKCTPSAAVAKTSVGLLADLVVAAGVAPYWVSRSNWNAGGTGTSTAQLQMVGFVQDGLAPDAGTPFANILVRVAEPQMGSSLVSVGV